MHSENIEPQNSYGDFHIQSDQFAMNNVPPYKEGECENCMMRQYPRRGELDHNDRYWTKS